MSLIGPVQLAVVFLAACVSQATAQVSVDLSAGGVSIGIESGSTPAVEPPASTPEGASVVEAPAASSASSSAEVALEAVASQRALPLDQILQRAALLDQGQVVDVQLLTVRGYLLYELKVIEADGQVRDIYFYAQSGQIVKRR